MQEEEEVRKSVDVCIVRLVAKDLFVTTISSLCFYPRQRLHLTPGGLCFLRTFFRLSHCNTTDSFGCPFF